MKPRWSGYWDIGPELNLALITMIALILGGNGLVIWQFREVQTQTDRLAGANQQLTAVLQLQVDLLSFHQRLDDLARSRDPLRLAHEAEPLRSVIREQARQARTAITNLPPVTQVDPSFLPMLETIQVTLPGQLDSIDELAKSGDWVAVQRRLDTQLTPIETQTSALVASVDEQARSELAQAVTGMRRVQNSILIIVPATAISTFCMAAFLGWSIARRIIELRLEERVSERTRVARELHDTLLQNFHGLMFQFQAARNLMRRQPDEAMRSLDDAINETKKALAESREAIQGLRSEPMAKGNLSELLMATSRELGDSSANEYRPVFDLIEEGERQTLSSSVGNEICRIALELMRNAYQHAHAQRIEVEIRYGDAMFRVRIRDDGKGIDPNVLKEGGKAGHWGLRGIRERADRIGAQLDLWSEPGQGTEAQLLVPASIAYENAGDGYKVKLFRKAKSRAVRS
jgi:signal transduction histidine kinase